ncbi:MAG: DNA polymerase I [Spirochaetales bacterium]|nr:DNA polymerase I [Spirochaetales bacterium]
MPAQSSFLIVDAHAMAYRAYYALAGQNLTDPATGQSTAAVFGFFRMLVKILGDYKPEWTAIVWDPPGKSFRSRDFPGYKAGRKPMPDDLQSQIEGIKILLSESGFFPAQVPDFEADDVMGTLARRFGPEHRILLLTADKDCFQLLNDSVSMLRSTKGVSEFVLITPDWVKQELGVRPDQIVDYMALVGDASDNIPGAAGVGPKSAAALIEQFGTIDNLYKNLDQVKQKGLREKLASSRENVFLSRELATIVTGIEAVTAIPLDDFRTPDLTAPSTMNLFARSGFQAIYQDLSRWVKKEMPEKKKAAGKKVKYTYVNNPETEARLKEALQKATVLAVDTETTSADPMRATLVGVSLSCTPGEAFYINCLPTELFSNPASSLEILRPFLENPRLPKIGQNIKYDLIVLERHGFHLAGIAFDTMIASYLLNPNVRRHNLDDMAMDLLGFDTIKYEDIAGSGRKQLTLDQVAPEKICNYACQDADLALQFKSLLEKSLQKEHLQGVFASIEMELIPVLANMEMTGVAIDLPYFQKLSRSYEKKIKQLEEKLHQAAGEEFNLHSTRELQKFLYDRLGLARGKKIKTGFSTDQKALENLRGEHEAVDWLLEHRRHSKLKSTYIDALPETVHPLTGRIHTSFNQTIAATGRLSSVNPNLQNIPIREADGRAIRKGFIAASGFELLSLDYSQIELRIMAHLSQDEGLLRAYRDDIDIHALTGSALFGIAPDKVSPDQRAQAKVLNFSTIYGVTEFGLAQNLSISREQARMFLNAFFERYPRVRRYMDETVAFAEKHGYVETLSGRRRQIPEIKSKNRFRREGAERMAINTPVQGTSADIIKIAMIQIHKELKRSKLKSRMILQVHDELLFEAAPPEREALLEIALRNMEGAMPLSVPVKVDYRFGQSWDDAH